MAENQIQDMNHTHEGILRWLLLNPDRPLRDCAAYMGVTQSWLSVIINSDCFRERLKELQGEFNIRVVQSLEEKLTTATNVALDRLITCVEASQDEQYILAAADKLLKSKGFGARANIPQGPTVNNYVLQGVDASFLTQQREALTAPAREKAVTPFEEVEYTEPLPAEPAPAFNRPRAADAIMTFEDFKGEF